MFKDIVKKVAAHIANTGLPEYLLAADIFIGEYAWLKYTSSPGVCGVCGGADVLLPLAITSFLLINGGTRTLDYLFDTYGHDRDEYELFETEKELVERIYYGV